MKAVAWTIHEEVGNCWYRRDSIFTRRKPEAEDLLERYELNHPNSKWKLEPLYEHSTDLVEAGNALIKGLRDNLLGGICSKEEAKAENCGSCKDLHKLIDKIESALKRWEE